jgi:uncharacterized protein (DUF1501 family)
MNRRRFFKSTSLASATLMVPSFLNALNWRGSNMPLGFEGKTLIVIQFSGGNDGLNTLVPYQNDIYYKNRPSIGLKPNEVVKITDSAGFHPQLPFLADLYADGNLSVLSNVGYPNPNRSHFRSMDIWQSASSSDQYLQTGWLGRFLDSNCTKPYQGIELDDSLSLALRGNVYKGLAFKNAESLYKSSKKICDFNYTEGAIKGNTELDFLSKTLVDTKNSAEYIFQKYKTITPKGEYPDSAFGNQLKTIAALINADSEIPIYYVSLSSFDTHVSQKAIQGSLFRQYNAAMQALVYDLRLTNKFKNTAVLTFSEFGRRVKENSGKGTDHGTANYVFVASGGLKNPGLENGLPNLSTLEDGDLIYSLDFRQVYATLISNWLQANDEQILGQKFQKLNFL